jgi:hypothetical protein
MSGRGAVERAKLRIARLLAHGPAAAAAGAAAGTALLDAGKRGTVAAPEPILAAKASAGLIRAVGGRLWLTGAGEAWLKRRCAPGDGFQAQHRDLDQIVVEVGGSPARLTVNLAESPLTVLARLKGRDGRPFLLPAEVRAGERLRADYDRGRIAPRLGAHWEVAVSDGRRGGHDTAGLTERALAARQRVERALAAVGPELAGVLIDICCFLKGLELVELERGWPVRSAKVVLKTALGALARHYEPQRPAAGKPLILHWGAADYRPRPGP